MSVQQHREPTQSTGSDETSGKSKRERLVSYIRDQIESGGGELYFKGKFIADEVDLSPKVIGQLMVQLEDNAPDGLDVEAWSYTAATTWRVTTQ